MKAPVRGSRLEKTFNKGEVNYLTHCLLRALNDRRGSMVFPIFRRGGYDMFGDFIDFRELQGLFSTETE